MEKKLPPSVCKKKKKTSVQRVRERSVKRTTNLWIFFILKILCKDFEFFQLHQRTVKYSVFFVCVVYYYTHETCKINRNFMGQLGFIKDRSQMCHKMKESLKRTHKYTLKRTTEMEWKKNVKSWNK